MTSSRTWICILESLPEDPDMYTTIFILAAGLMELVRWDRAFEMARTERSVDPDRTYIYEVLIVGKFR